MNQLMRKPYFRILAIVLGLCFVVFAFHFVMHLEHADEPLNECAVCQLMTTFILLVILGMSLKGVLQKGTRFQLDVLFWYQNPSLTFFSSRAPPHFS